METFKRLLTIAVFVAFVAWGVYLTLRPFPGVEPIAEPIAIPQSSQPFNWQTEAPIQLTK